MENKAKPYINIGPGQILKREMEALNWNQDDLAQIISMAPKSISQILNNKQKITIDTAVLLGRAFHTSPEFWLNLDNQYRLRSKTETKKELETEIKAKIRQHMPLLEMRKKGWIQFDNKADTQINAYCKFWGMEKPDFSFYATLQKKICARQAKDDGAFTAYYTKTWLHKAEEEASKIKANNYQSKKVEPLLQNISSYTLQEDGVNQFIQDLKEIGIKFLVVSHLEKTYLDGAAFMNGPNPVVVFTGRHKGFDSFWWTMAHELSHVLLHLKEKGRIFLDNLDNKGESLMEAEADMQAGYSFQKEKILERVHKVSRFSEIKLLELTRQFNIHPAVILGILQFEGHVTYRTQLNSYKGSVLDHIPKQYIKG